jgi:hypothetical protein
LAVGTGRTRAGAAPAKASARWSRAEQHAARNALREKCPRDLAIGAFAAAYADQNEQDHAALKRAVRKGTIEAAVA